MNPENRKSGDGQPASILAVDDTPANLQVLAGMLKDRGYKVRPVPSGKLALLAAQRDPPDLILLDINMPEMNGFEVQARLAEIGMRLPVILITGHDSTESGELALSMGPAAYFRKPVDGQALLDAIAVAPSRGISLGKKE